MCLMYGDWEVVEDFLFVMFVKVVSYVECYQMMIWELCVFFLFVMKNEYISCLWKEMFECQVCDFGVDVYQDYQVDFVDW